MNTLINNIDNFTINLFNYGNDKEQMMFWLPMLVRKVKGEIHIINFSKVNMNEFINECREKWINNNVISEDDFKKIITEIELPCSINLIYDYVERLTIDDYVFIVGGEHLLPYSQGGNFISTKFEHLNINMKLMQHEDWNTLCKDVDKLYEDYQYKIKGILLNLGIDANTKKIILSELKDSNNMSIVSFASLENDKKYNEIVENIYSKINNSTLDNLVTYINNNKEYLEDKSYVLLLTNIYISFGIASKSIDLLEKNYKIISNEEKRILADLLSRNGQGGRAKEVLLEIFNEDKFLKDLMPSILRVYSTDPDNTRDAWLKEALKVDPENPKVIEHYANWLSHTKNYQEASKQFRILGEKLQNKYYEIVAVINDVLNNNFENNNEIENAMLNVINSYPNLNNEGILRLVIYFKEIYKSEFLTYKLLSRINYDSEDELLYQLINIKLDMLEDILVTSKALRKLKPFNKPKDADIISKERVDGLVKAILPLAKYRLGYLDWRRFIDNCQSDNGWDRNIVIQYINELSKLNNINIDDIYTNSYAGRIVCHNCSSELEYRGISLLRAIKNEEFEIDTDEIEEIIIGAMKAAEVDNNEELRIWSRYYASIIYSYRGNTQQANNAALTLLDYYNRVSGENRELCLILGLVSWGNSQFKIGRINEGILCIISCIDLALKINEISPIIEECGDIFYQYLLNNNEIINTDEKKKLISLFSKLECYNSNLNYIEYVINDDVDNLIEKLESEIFEYNLNEFEINQNIVRLIWAYNKRNDVEQVINLIKKYNKAVVESYKNRIDLRGRILTDWVKFIFDNRKLNKEEYELALSLLEIVIDDIEIKRNSAHKEERAIIGDIAQKIYRQYIEIKTMLLEFKENGNENEKQYVNNIENIVNKMAVRSIIEQKYYNNLTIDKKLMEKERQFIKLREEYDILYKKSNGGNGAENQLNNLGNKMQQLQEYLIENHPHYMSLPKVSKVKFTDIKESLNSNEVFYQCIKLKKMCISIFITDKEVKIKKKIFKDLEVEKLLNDLNNGIYEYKSNVNEMISMLSEYFYGELIKYCKENKVSRVYTMPDFSLGVFNSIMSNIDGEYLIDLVDSIVNTLDYNMLLEEKKDYKCTCVANSIIGDKNDKNLKLINKYLSNNNRDNFCKIDQNDDNLDYLISFIKDNKVDSLFLYGHGVEDPKGYDLGGALGIKGTKNLIRLNSIIKKLDNVKNIVLLSCRGGVPLSSNLESSTGSWAETFEMFRGNIMICKWEVDTEASIFIIDKMICHNNVNSIGIDKAINLAIREARDKYNIPSYWAGIEFWVN